MIFVSVVVLIYSLRKFLSPEKDKIEFSWILISDYSGEDAVLGLPETGLAIIPGYVLNFVFKSKFK